MTRDKIIHAIEVCAAETGLAPSTITERAVRNSRLYWRLKNGGECRSATGRKLMAFVATLRTAQQSEVAK